MCDNMREPHSIGTTDTDLVQPLRQAIPCSEQLNHLPPNVRVLQPFMRLAIYDISENAGRCGEKIDYILPREGSATIHIGESGMPTAQDHDFVILLTSQLAHQLTLDMGEPTKTLTMSISEILDYFQRPNTRKNIAEFEQSLTRLKETNIEIRYKLNRKLHVWQPEGFIQNFDLITCSTTGKPTEVQVAVSSWMYDLVVISRGKQALLITPRYFKISSGIGRYLYLIASTNRASDCMFWSREKIYTNSESQLPLDEFWEWVCNYVKNTSIPDFEIMVTQGKHKPLLAMRRRLEHFLNEVRQT